MLRSMVLYIVLCLCVPFLVECRFITFYYVEHETTGQKVILLGDCHGQEKYAYANKAALINLAYAFDAHIIVEDMSDYSFLENYIDATVLSEVDFFSLQSAHSRKRLAYTSLSLTHHCQRKNVSVHNVEFRHKDTKSISILPCDIYFDVLDRLLNDINEETYKLLDESHKGCIEDISLFCRNRPFIDQESDLFNSFDRAICLLLDILIMQELVVQTSDRPDRMIIICAGAYHIDNIRDMLTKHKYVLKNSLIYDYYTMREIQVMPLCNRYFYDNNKEGKRCITSMDIKLNDRRRVWGSLIRRALTVGSICAAAIAAASFYIKSKYFEQYYQW